jgi:hypothetical protein
MAQIFFWSTSTKATLGKAAGLHDTFMGLVAS